MDCCSGTAELCVDSQLFLTSCIYTLQEGHVQYIFKWLSRLLRPFICHEGMWKVLAEFWAFQPQELGRKHLKIWD